METGIYSSMRERLSHLPGTLAQGERVHKVKTAHVVHGIKTPPPQSIFHHVNRVTTDPLSRTRSITASACQRHETTECPEGQLDLMQNLAVL